MATKATSAQLLLYAAIAPTPPSPQSHKNKLSPSSAAALAQEWMASVTLHGKNHSLKSKQLVIKPLRLQGILPEVPQGIVDHYALGVSEVGKELAKIPTERHNCRTVVWIANLDRTQTFVYPQPKN